MFTGLIRNLGEIQNVANQNGLRISIAHKLDLPVALGDSIACNGVCLTVAAMNGDVLQFDVSPETIAKTTAGNWKKGTPINLEPSLRLGDFLGGHLVYGHVDGIAELASIVPENGSYRISFKPPGNLAKYLAQKGSVALDGISLTINDSKGDEFSVMIVPHTWQETNLRHLKPGDKVNCEIDIIARYVEKMIGADNKGI